MNKCNARITLGSGYTIRCQQSRVAGGLACYLHQKYYDGICIPLEYEPLSTSTTRSGRNEKVASVTFSDGHRMNY
jgi:hypothetical protein